jgi:hypothetical protein
MSSVIGKGPEAAASLMSEVEALFDMTVKQRSEVEAAVDICTDPAEPETSYCQFYEMAGLFECRVSGQPIEAEDHTDGDGNPDGGWVEGCGLSIRWQRGPLDDGEDGLPWNGCFPVTLLEAVKHRLEYYQDGKFACQDNSAALFHIESAIKILNNRQIERFCRGVRNSHEE